MDNDEIEKIVKKLANQSHAMSTAIDLDQLIKNGALKLIGKSYYIQDIKLLPEHAKERIKSLTQGKHGTKGNRPPCH